MSYEIFWNFIPFVMKYDYCNYVEKFWKKFENVYGNYKIFSENPYFVETFEFFSFFLTTTRKKFSINTLNLPGRVYPRLIFLLLE